MASEPKKGPLEAFIGRQVTVFLRGDFTISGLVTEDQRIRCDGDEGAVTMWTIGRDSVVAVGVNDNS